jgi:hypothetical protein
MTSIDQPVINAVVRTGIWVGDSGMGGEVGGGGIRRDDWKKFFAREVEDDI